MLASYLEKKKIRSTKTAETYAGGLKVWAKSIDVADADAGVKKIIDEHLDVYEVLQGFVSHLHNQGKAPKTTWLYFGCLKSFLIDSDVPLDIGKAKAKIVLPARYEVSTDRAPTLDEVKRIVLRSKLGTKAAITILASSGLRIGELVQLKVGNIEFGKDGESPKITLKAAMTKTRKRRLTFMSPEAGELLKEHLGSRINDANAKLFPEGLSAYRKRITRSIDRTGLRSKFDEESKRYELHPHSFRKYFFSNMLSAGVDRGIVESFMGHKFGEDSAYLRMTDSELRQAYTKGADRLTFLSRAPEQIRKQEEELKKMQDRLEKLESIYSERIKLRE